MEQVSAAPSAPSRKPSTFVQGEGESVDDFARRMYWARARMRMTATGTLSTRRCATLIADAMGCHRPVVECALRGFTYAKVLSAHPGRDAPQVILFAQIGEAPAWLQEALTAIVDDCAPHGWQIVAEHQGPYRDTHWRFTPASLDVAPFAEVPDTASVRAAAMSALRKRRAQGRRRLVRYLRSTGRIALAGAVEGSLDA